MSDDLFVECPIHLDAVSITDILVFKCGHGFCEPCLEEHFAHQAYSHVTCPSCRKPVRRKEAFPLFLAPAQPQASSATAGSQPVHEASRMRLKIQLQEARAAHENCPERFVKLHQVLDALGQDAAYHNQAMQHLRGRYELLEERLANEVDESARAREESSRMKEEVTKLQVENHKTSKALEQALSEVQVQLERVKTFQGYIDRYKHKCNLEKKKRKALENANHHLQPRKEEDSLMVVDVNEPDVLHQDKPDFAWLDDACKVRGDPLGIPDDDDLESEMESEDELMLIDPDSRGKRREDRAPGPPLQFRSDWNLRLDTLGGPSSQGGMDRKQRHGGTRQVGGSRIIKVKMQGGSETRKPVGGPLTFDRQGRIKGLVALGARQKLNSKN